MEPLTLYVDRGWTSPWAMTAFVALTEKGLDFEVREVDLAAGEARTYGARTGRIPALVHGDYWLAESLAIAEYAAETFPYPKAADTMLFPPDLRDRGVCREIMMWLRSDLFALRAERPTSTLFGGSPAERRQAPLSPAAEEDAARLLAACARWLDHDRETLFDLWCIADPDLGLALDRLGQNGYALPPRLAAYADACRARPSVAAFHAHPRG